MRMLAIAAVAAAHALGLSQTCTSVNRSLGFSLDLSSASPWVRQGNFSVRQTNCILADGRFWCYADLIWRSNPYYPNTYNTTIHLFSAAADAPLGPWQYESEVLPFPTDPAAWDAGGVATPGAALMSADGTVALVYSGRQHHDGSGRRSIGLATAPHPKGPFTRRGAFVWTVSDSHVFDDPQLVSHEPSGRLLLLHRRSSYADGTYQVLRSAFSSNESLATAGVSRGWSAPETVLASDSDVRAREPFDAKWIPKGSAGGGSDGRLVLITDQFYFTRTPTMVVAAFVSMDTHAFCPAEPPVVHPGIPRPFAGPIYTLLQDADGEIRHALLLELDAHGGGGSGPVAYRLNVT
jgi:hypothetical protein